MDAKGIVAVVGFSLAVVFAGSALFAWVRGVQAGGKMREYLRVNHPERWAQLESGDWLTRNNDHIFYNLGPEYEGDPAFEALKRNFQHWYARLLTFMGILAACIFATFVIELVIQAK